MCGIIFTLVRPSNGNVTNNCNIFVCFRTRLNHGWGQVREINRLETVILFSGKSLMFRLGAGLNIYLGQPKNQLLLGGENSQLCHLFKHCLLQMYAW